MNKTFTLALVAAYSSAITLRDPAQDPDAAMKEAAKLDFAIDDDNNDDIMDIGEFTRAFERLC